VDGVTLRTNAAVSADWATAQDITRQATIVAMWWGALGRRDHSAVRHSRCAPISQEMILRSAIDA